MRIITPSSKSTYFCNRSNGNGNTAIVPSGAGVKRLAIGGQSNGSGAGATGLKIGGGTSVIDTKAPNTAVAPNGLGDQLAQAQKQAAEIVAFKQKPLLVYLMVDLTGSRKQSREAMRPYESELAKYIMQAGGEHPVICMGVFHKGGQAYPPQKLDNPEDILRFLDETPSGGVTDIKNTLQSYWDDKTESLLSIGIYIGDAYDGDNAGDLIELSKQLKAKKRPLIIAHQETNCDDFCTEVGPEMAKDSGGLSFELGTTPDAFHAFLKNIRDVMSATPDKLKKTAKGQSGGLRFAGDAATQNLAKAQAQQLLLTHG